MRIAILAGLLLTTGCAATAAQTGDGRPDLRTAAAEQEVAPDGEAPATEAESAEPQPMEALLAADLDRLATDARRHLAEGDDAASWASISFIDAFNRGQFAEARQALERMPDGVSGNGADMFEPFLLVAERRGDFALERLTHGAGGIPDPYPDIARALVLEALGRPAEAAAAYAEIVASIDVRPGPDGEARDEAELMRSLQATRTSQTLYRAALVNHRLGRREEASRLYGLVAAFAPLSADLVANRARLERGQAPFEPPLDAKRALGRWLLFLSDYMQQTEGLAKVILSQGPVEGLTSPSGTMFLQFGIELDPSAEDWTVAAAGQLVEARAFDGAKEILGRIREDSVFAADAQLGRASMLMEQREDAQAVQAAERAVALDGNRWSVIAGAGDIFRLAGRDRESIAAHDRALALARDAEDRADILSYRAYAHRFAGRINEAARDAEAALELNRKDNIRYTAVTILMDHPNDWREAVRIAREMFAESPDSSTRLNSLGYALIQRPEGLEEGYRLLWRGFSFRDTDYAVVDSLGWAYYLHGVFPEARHLIERAADLSRDDPNAEILDHLGDVYWRVDEQDRARDAWRQALAARPDAIRRRSLEGKIERGLTAPAPARRDLPRVELPRGPRERGDT